MRSVVRQPSRVTALRGVVVTRAARPLKQTDARSGSDGAGRALVPTERTTCHRKQQIFVIRNPHRVSICCMFAWCRSAGSLSRVERVSRAAP